MKLTTFISAAILSASHACYYNHELSVEQLLFKWRDVASGPFPGIGFQVSDEEYVFELEGEDLTAVSAGGDKYEFSVPFAFNEVDLREKSLCDWGYGCAHCQHVADDACSRRLYAISAVSDHLGELVDGSNGTEILTAAFDTVLSELVVVCETYTKSGESDEEYLTNDIVEACSATCLEV